MRGKSIFFLIIFAKKKCVSFFPGERKKKLFTLPSCVTDQKGLKMWGKVGKVREEVLEVFRN